MPPAWPAWPSCAEPVARPGRKPNPNKRVPLSLLVDPALRSTIVDLAEQSGRTITQQVELLLLLGIRDMADSEGRLARIEAKLDQLLRSCEGK
jgi:hypothetical protein